jgi:thiol-disulfide isomerase/thioredoxin
MNTNEMSTSSEIEAQLQLLDPKMNNKYVKLAKEHLDCVKKTEVGQIFPIIELPDPDGKLISTESFHGKYLYVDFWASWCNPCMKEMPTLKIAYQKYHEKGLEILGISLDDKREAWINCIIASELNWLHISDLKGFKSPITKELAVNYIPHTFLLDPNGVILAVDLRGEYLLNKLEEMMQ